MSMQSRFTFIFRNLFRKEQRNRELDAELRSYVELLTEENLRSGLSPDQARREAMLTADRIDPIAEQVREIRAGAIIETVVQDIRYGLRSLRRNPGFTITAVLALALGIGANAAIFSVVNAVLIRPLPYATPDQLAVILRNGSGPVAAANYFDWKSQSHSFSDMAAAELWSPNLTGDGQAEKLPAMRVTPNMLPLLGSEPILGRVHSQHSPEAAELVLSYSLWQRRFGGRPDVIGHTLRLNGEPFTVVGVMPRDFKFAPFWATKAEAWAPLDLRPRSDNRTGASLRVFARLKPEVSLKQASAEMATIASRLEQQFPGTNRDITVGSLKEKVVGDIRPALLVLMGAVGLVLLIACGNVAHMLLARAAARRRETAIRSALGARRSRLVRQFLTESTVLSLVGGLCGLTVAAGGIRLLLYLSPASIPRLESISLDSNVLLFVIAISLLTGIVFGTVPALQASASNPGESLKEGGRNIGAALHGRMRSIMVASEFAMAVVLLIAAGLMIRTLVSLYADDPGFNPHNVLSMTISVAGSAESQPGKRAAFYQQVMDNVQNIPGVHSVSSINHLPLAGDNWGAPFQVEGRPAFSPEETPSATYRVVQPRYFATMQIPLLRGRDFTPADDLRAAPVVIINQKFADEFWPSEDPMGKRIQLDGMGAETQWRTIVGVVKNDKRSDWVAPPEPEAFIPLMQASNYLENQAPHFSSITLVVRTTGDSAALANSVKQQVWHLDSAVPIYDVTTMEDVVSTAVSEPRFFMALLAGFACIALVLAAIGIYGVLSYAVSLRTQELGVRIALGASRGDVLRLVIRQGMTLALLGGAAGLLCAFFVSRLMSSLLYGVRPTDFSTFAMVPLVLCVVALMACYLPAARASRIDPISALRSE